MNLSYIINHLGEERSQYLYSISPPVFQSSNFTFKDVASMRNSLKNEMNVPFYTRGCNPTVAILRKKLAALAGSDDALVFSSGSAAISAAVLSQVQTGDHIVCVAKPYSWTQKLLMNHLSRFGVKHTMVDGTDVNNFAEAIMPNTKVLFLESPNSITFELQNISQVVQLAKKHNLVSIIDNSYSTPLWQQPIAMGIDIVCHSASKYLGGHSDIVAGVLCSNNTIIKQVFEGEYMTMGGIISPHDAWLMIRGLRTLPLRMKQVAENTTKVIDFLTTHPLIEKVYFPFAADSLQLKLAKQQMRNAGGLLSVLVKANNMAQMEQFCNSLQYFILACSWGGYESLIFPMCVLHSSQNYDKSIQPWNLVRLFIGLEEAEVLINDLAQALNSMGVDQVSIVCLSNEK